MRRLIIISLCVVGACQDGSASNSNTLAMGNLMQNWPEEEKELSRCLHQHNQLSKCVPMSRPQRMHGVWYAGFEESGFIADVNTVPLVRDTPTGPNDIGREYRTILEVDALGAMRQLGLPERDRCIRAVAIDFIGRKGKAPGESLGYQDEVVVVDRLLGGRLIGKVRTRGLAGYDAQCATPSPSEEQIKALDEADLKRLKASGNFIPQSKLPDRYEKVN